MIYLTSFKVYHDQHWHIPGYSIAVYQPRWYPELPKIDLFDIRKDGKWIRPRDFIPEDHTGEADLGLVKRYHDTLYDLYLRRIWTSTTKPVPDGDIALCCWCPFDKAAKRQLKQFGSFVCHSYPVESVLKYCGYDVQRDKDRERMVK